MGFLYKEGYETVVRWKELNDKEREVGRLGMVKGVGVCHSCKGSYLVALGLLIL